MWSSRQQPGTPTAAADAKDGVPRRAAAVAPVACVAAAAAASDAGGGAAAKDAAYGQHAGRASAGRGAGTEVRDGSLPGAVEQKAQRGGLKVTVLDREHQQLLVIEGIQDNIVVLF